MNTTDSIIEQVPRRAPRTEVTPHHVVVGTQIYDEMEEVDAPAEIAFISPAHNYVARFDDESTRPIVLWVVMDDGTFYGVALPEDGRPPLELSNIEKETGFSKYEHKEDK